MGHKHHKISRRSFLGQASCAAVGYTTLFSTITNLKMLNAAAGLNSKVQKSGDYKALVCLLNSGGMDSFNMLIPRGNPEYSQYATSRTNMAIPQNSLLPVSAATPDGRLYGLHPSLTRSKTLFDEGKMAFVSNVGALVRPITRQQFFDGTVPIPLGLFSHSDQQQHWQTGIPHSREAVGWGGKIADMLIASNENQNVSMSMSLSGSNLFQTGNSTVEFALRPLSGAVGIDGRDDDWIVPEMKMAALNGMMNNTYSDIYKKTYTHTVKKAMLGFEDLQPILDNPPVWNVPFVNEGGDYNPSLNMYFEMIARTIAGREALGMSRQIFFIDYGGWDHHDELLGNQAAMLIQLDKALHQFNAAMEQLGIADCVTTFCLSEFSRTLSSNGNGTDHAWGGNTFVMGGAVNGQDIYGAYPQLNRENSNPLHLYNGVLLPTMSADVYFAEIAMWFGVPVSELSTLFPNIGYFYDVNSGNNPVGFLEL
ncbi:MAG: DUF1501 domain-containing protein [Saprospiraceae bacterium]|nr:DUF1501 domain-containing protein [Saprospiraceae bacterium]